ncbi:9152_t:CDS:2, partial [Racocetra persica]
LSCPNSVATQQEKNSKITVGYVNGYYYDYTFDASKLPWNITHINWIAFKPDDQSNKDIPFSGANTAITNLNKTVKYRNDNKINTNIFLAIVLSGNLNINNDFKNKQPFASNKTERASFVSNVINFVYKFGLDGVDLEYPDRYGCGKWNGSENFIPLVDELSSALKVIKKSLSITVGNNPIKGLNISSTDFINVMPFKQNEISNKTGPSITFDQISNIMDGWSKTVDPKKLILGVAAYGIVELTKAIDGSLDNNNTVPLDTTVDIKAFVFDATSSSDNSSTASYYDVCSFKEVYYLNVGSCLAIRSKTGPLSSSCTAQNGWTRVFDSNVKSTYIFKVYNTSVVVGSPNPLTTYYYVTYEDFQSIQYKLKLIIDKSYGGIALDGLGIGCDDMIRAVESIFPVDGYNPPPGPSSNSNVDPLSAILVALACLVFCCGGGGYYYDQYGRKYLRVG